MKRSTVIGVMGPGEKAGAIDLQRAERLGFLIAKKNWDTLTGGRPVGVMEAALKGAKEAGGRTIGILMSKDRADASAYADIVIATGMGSARNVINILSCDIVVACGGEAGTASEIALAIKSGKPVILLSDNKAAMDFFHGLAPASVFSVNTPEEAVALIENILSVAEDRQRA